MTDQASTAAALPFRARALPGYAALLLAAMATLFGGASHGAPAQLLAVELAALPLLGLGLIAARASRAARRLGLGSVAVVLAVAIPVLQILPLPPAAWQALPGREALVHGLAAAGLSAPWLPASLTPGATERALLALAPPIAMLAGTLALSETQRLRLVVVWLALALTSLAIGVGQLLAPPSSLLWFYPVTNVGSLVGFFANRNHEASFLLAALPLASLAWLEARRHRSAIGALVCAGFVVVAVAGIFAVRSRFGVLLCLPTLLGCAALIWRSDQAPRLARSLATLSAAAVVLAIIATLGAKPILDRLDNTDRAEIRAEAWPHIQAAADAFQPVGAGVGAFDTVYRSVEPLNAVTDVYVNHAHNEYLELWLEAGWPGMIALALFAFWLLDAIPRAWRRRDEGADLARAGSVVALVLLAHSFVDYPLRTTALSVLFAFACALLARPTLNANQPP